MYFCSRTSSRNARTANHDKDDHGSSRNGKSDEKENGENQDNENGENDGDENEEDDDDEKDKEVLPKGLVMWREGIRQAQTAAQVAMAFYILETSIAWHKSIMKAFCQLCHCGDNEDSLLLCDGLVL